jgi:hypothetical protein
MYVQLFWYKSKGGIKEINGEFFNLGIVPVGSMISSFKDELTDEVLLSGDEEGFRALEVPLDEEDSEEPVYDIPFGNQKWFYMNRGLPENLSEIHSSVFTDLTDTPLTVGLSNIEALLITPDGLTIMYNSKTGQPFKKTVKNFLGFVESPISMAESVISLYTTEPEEPEALMRMSVESEPPVITFRYIINYLKSLL